MSRTTALTVTLPLTTTVLTEPCLTSILGIQITQIVVVALVRNVEHQRVGVQIDSIAGLRNLEGKGMK